MTPTAGFPATLAVVIKNILGKSTFVGIRQLVGFSPFSCHASRLKSPADTGEKKFKCTASGCTRKFAREDSLNRHKRILHVGKIASSSTNDISKSSSHVHNMATLPTRSPSLLNPVEPLNLPFSCSSSTERPSLSGSSSKPLGRRPPVHDHSLFPSINTTQELGDEDNRAAQDHDNPEPSTENILMPSSTGPENCTNIADSKSKLCLVLDVQGQPAEASSSNLDMLVLQHWLDVCR